MIVEKTIKLDEIKSVITHPDIWRSISSDNTVKRQDWMPISGRLYLKGEDKGEVFGITSVNRKSKIVYNVHFNVIPEYRKEYAVDFAKHSIEWLKKNTEVRKLVAEIPEFHKNVVNFAKKLGFTEEGVNSKSFLKDGRLYNQIYLGLCYE